MIFKEVPADFKPKIEVSGCFLEHDGRILLLLRPEHKSQGGRWGVPGGKADRGETPLEACVREVHEETGLALATDHVEPLSSVNVRHGEMDFVYHMFRARFEEQPEVALNAEEHVTHRWVTPKEALQHTLIEDEDYCLKLTYPQTADPVRKKLTLCFVHESDRVLLGLKKRGFGAGRWNGFGGKVAPDESIEEAALRELKEEAGIDADNMAKTAVLDFQFASNPEEILEVHVFRIDSYRGKPSESEEMKPQWYDEHAIPYDHMWPDDCLWLPLYLEGKKLRARFLFGENDSVLEHSIQELASL